MDNFVKIHKSLSVPPMQAGLIKRLMTIEDIANFVVEAEPKKEVLIKRK